MVDLAEIQAAYYMVAATGVLVAAIYYVYNMRTSQKNSKAALETRQAQLFMDIYKATYEREFLEAGPRIFSLKFKDTEDYERIMNNPEEYKAFYMFGNWVEGMGVLVREGLIDIRLVSLLESGPIQAWWQNYSEGIMRTREKFGFPRYMVESEYLVQRINEYGKAHPELNIATPDIKFSQ